MLIDSHCHITDAKYGDGGAAIAEAMERDGLAALVCVGCDAASSRAAVEAARKYKNVYAAVGVHPYYPEEVTDKLLDEFREYTKDEKVVGIGEIGLDYHYGDSDRKAQTEALVRQYEFSLEVELPVIFHVRAAAGDFTEFLRGREFPYGGEMHCFSGSWETAEICLKRGLYIAFGGKLTYRNSKNLHEVARLTPEDRLLVETDAPYLSPAQKYNEINYPRNVAYVCDKLAELRGTDRARIEDITYKNAKTLFARMR